MLGRRFAVSYSDSNHVSGTYGAIVLATMRHDDTGSVASGTAALTSREAYRIRLQRHGAATQLVITGATPAAQLYGVFHLLEEIAAQRPIPIDEHQSPAATMVKRVSPTSGEPCVPGHGGRGADWTIWRPIQQWMQSTLVSKESHGGHTDAPNMKYFIQWADKFIGHVVPQS
jgi:hypothetical protein